MLETDSQRVTLADIPTGSNCVIVRLAGHGGFRHRLMEMGFVRGEKVRVVKNAPLQDPIEYEIMGGHVSLRRIEAQHIEVVQMSEEMADIYRFNGTVTEEVVKAMGPTGKQITIALVGNPNCGKTSFFNRATGLREKVGNYSGVTVDSKLGVAKHNGYVLNFVDLPGTYSITEYTPEELYVRRYIADSHPDVLLNVVDASNLARNLFLTTQLIDMNVPMIMALNMYDELEKNGDKLDVPALSRMFGFPIIPTVSTKGTGIEEIFNHIIDIYENREGISKHIHINYGPDIEKGIAALKVKMEVEPDYPSRYMAIKLLENDKVTIDEVGKMKGGSEILKTAEEFRTSIEKSYREDSATAIANAKYGFIRGALKETFVSAKNRSETLAYSIDNILTNKWLGFPILVFFLWFMFQMTFTIGAYPQAWLEMFFGWLGKITSAVLPEGILESLLVDGVIAGVGSVCSFLPNILILFFFISILEDTGYMARSAFIMDKLMHRIGLHGKSFIPYIIGFGCSVPAIMATRTLENRKDRILTIITVPFMSCSARLPVYLLLISAFFDKHQGLILVSIYLLGVLMSILTALLMKRVAFKNESDQFVMELPPYRIPTLRNAVVHMWDKSVQYVKKMGTVILGATVIIWALEYFPQHSAELDRYTAQIEQVAADSTLSAEAQNAAIEQLTLDRATVQTENSYIGRIGQFIAPVFRPLGFDWKMGVSLLTGIAAKEVVVSSMGVLYHADGEADENSSALKESLKAQVWTSGELKGQPVFTPLVAYAYLIFILLYFPCVAALSAVFREAGLKWAAFSMLYNTGVAWIAAFLIFQIGSLLL
jgi:ferrous iron transport protein B